MESGSRPMPPIEWTHASRSLRPSCCFVWATPRKRSCLVLSLGRGDVGAEAAPWCSLAGSQFVAPVGNNRGTGGLGAESGVVEGRSWRPRSTDPRCPGRPRSKGARTGNADVAGRMPASRACGESGCGLAVRGRSPTAADDVLLSDAECRKPSTGQIFGRGSPPQFLLSRLAAAASSKISRRSLALDGSNTRSWRRTMSIYSGKIARRSHGTHSQFSHPFAVAPAPGGTATRALGLLLPELVPGQVPVCRPFRS